MSFQTGSPATLSVTGVQVCQHMPTEVLLCNNVMACYITAFHLCSCVQVYYFQTSRIIMSFQMGSAAASSVTYVQVCQHTGEHELHHGK
jgi:hypothetical protein